MKVAYSYKTDHKSLENSAALADKTTKNGKIFIFMGEGQHKIKRKAEQIACNEALTFISSNNEDINLDE